MDESNTIEAFDPATIMFFIMGILSDFAFLGMLGLVIPAVGLAIAFFVLGMHYFFGIIISAFFWGKTRGWLPKVLLLISCILPLPLLTIGLMLAIIGSNKFAALIIEQVAIQAVAVATAGAGEALEGGAAVAEGAEAAGAATEGVTAAGEAAEASGATAEAGAGMEGAGTAEGTEAAEAGEDADLTREEKNPMENLQEDLTQPQEDQLREESGEKKSGEGGAEEEPEEKENKSTRRMRDIIDRANTIQDKREEEEDDEDISEAA